MVDKVKPLKIENSTLGGTENDPFPTEVDPSEDYIAAKGISFEGLDTKLIYPTGDDLGWSDPNSSGFKKFNDLNAAAFASRFSINLQHNGSVSGGTFLGYNELIPGDTSPVVIPVNAVMKAFSFTNSSNTADYTLIFRKNSTGATPFLSVSKVNTQFFAQSVSDQSFSAGDRIYVQYQDDGNNASDVAMTLMFQAV